MMQLPPLMPDMHMPPYYDPFMPLPELQVSMIQVKLDITALQAQTNAQAGGAHGAAAAPRCPTSTCRPTTTPSCLCQSCR